ncbi:hypothetical protein D018_1607B, partial [Vibrio parahaemolyticus VP2007-007]
LNFDS